MGADIFFYVRAGLANLLLSKLLMQGSEGAKSGCKELLKVLSVKVSLSPILLVSAGRILAHRIHFMRRIL